MTKNISQSIFYVRVVVTQCPWIGGTLEICLTALFTLDEPHRHKQNLVGTLHKGVPTVVYQNENGCKALQDTAWVDASNVMLL